MIILGPFNTFLYPVSCWKMNTFTVLLFFFIFESHSLSIFPQVVQRSSSPVPITTSSSLVMLDTLECPDTARGGGVASDREFKDLVSDSINLQIHILFIQ